MLNVRGGKTTLDQGQKWPGFPSQEAETRDCRSCAIAQQVADPSTRRITPYVAKDVDEDVVVVSGPELDGFVVIPRQHIGGLEDLPLAPRAHVLAALRRVTLLVQESNPGSAAAVIVMTDLPASEDHVCFQVVPVVAGIRCLPPEKHLPPENI